MNDSYKQAGVDIDTADAAKRDMAKSLETADRRVLNRIGAFSSLFEGRFPECRDPILVLKMEEPGSKQKLAFAQGRIESICFDLINHLVNDVAVMGAAPLAVLDTVICGKLEKGVVNQIVDSLARACREQSCSLVGGETSEQPGVLPEGSYVLAASMLGVVDREAIVDGSRIRSGDTVLAVASNGLHTNGYSLVRKLLEQDPKLEGQLVAGEPFIEAIMRPHQCYYRGLQELWREKTLRSAVHGLAHITGGGIQGNVHRIIPSELCAEIDLGLVRVTPVFKFLHSYAALNPADLLKTFNMGVGLVVVCEEAAQGAIIEALKRCGYESYVVGAVIAGDQRVMLRGELALSGSI